MEMLAKPFSAEDLALSVRKMIEGRSIPQG
jgi:hypothetical protein